MPKINEGMNQIRTDIQTTPENPMQRRARISRKNRMSSAKGNPLLRTGNTPKGAVKNPI